MNASSKFETLFKECHIQTGEAQAWKGGEPVALSDRPMHNWESTLKFERKILKLLQSTEAFVAEIKERGWVKNSKQTTIYPANWLRKKFIQVSHLVTLAGEADILEILDNFIQQTKFVDNDILTYLECVDVTIDLKNLHNKAGKHSKKLLNELLKGELQEWLRKTDYPDNQSQFDEKGLMMLYQESVSLYHNIWGSYFENSIRSDMYTIFSMKMFKKEVKSLNETTNFGAQQEKDLINHFSNEVMFEAEYPKHKVKLSHQLPLVMKTI